MKQLGVIMLIFLLMVLPTCSVVSAQADTGLLTRIFRAGLLNQEFEQYLEIEYDTSLINESLKIDQSLNVPITLSYWTNIPSSLWTKGVWGIGVLGIIQAVAFMVANKVVYGMGMPQQYIQLNITSRPKWLNCNFTKSRFPINFNNFNDSTYERGSLFLQSKTGDPAFVKEFKDVDKSIINTSLILSPLSDAPAQQYSISFEVYLASKGMVKAALFEKTITFTPSFFPKIDFTVEKPVQFHSPQQSVNFPITVTNYANKKIKVIPDLKNDSYAVDEINPKYLTLYPNESSVFYFSKFTGKVIGWYDTINDYSLDFYVELAPFQSNNTFGLYSVDVSLNTYGFSTPGFELFFVIFSFGLVIFIHRRRRIR